MTTGVENTGVGIFALSDLTTGSFNTAVGQNAAADLTTGYDMVAVGIDAARLATTAHSSTLIGRNAGKSITTGIRNTIVGKDAGGQVTIGEDNVFVGFQAGWYTNYTTGGVGNVMIGDYTQPASGGSNHNYNVNIGYNATGKGDRTGMIQVQGGGVYQSNNSSSWSTTSDRRLKKDITDNNTGLEAINQVRVRNFKYRDSEEINEVPSDQAITNKPGVQLGVIAQEIKEVLPDMVRTETTGVMSVDPDNMTWYLVNAVKELSAKVAELESKLQES
jgi:hypothetical protein